MLIFNHVFHLAQVSVGISRRPRSQRTEGRGHQANETFTEAGTSEPRNDFSDVFQNTAEKQNHIKKMTRPGHKWNPVSKMIKPYVTIVTKTT